MRSIKILKFFLFIIVFLIGQTNIVIAESDSTAQDQEVKKEIIKEQVQIPLSEDLNDQDQVEKIKVLEEKVTDLEEFKLRLTILGLSGAGMTVFALLWLYFLKIPKLVEEQAKKKIDALLVTERNTFKNWRLAVLSDTVKNKHIHDYLTRIGFSNDKLNPFAVGDYENITVDNTDVLFFYDENDKLDLESITQITKHFEGQLKFFYFGPKRLPDELFKTIGSSANSMDTLESNLYKALRL